MPEENERNDELLTAEEKETPDNDQRLMKIHAELMADFALAQSPQSLDKKQRLNDRKFAIVRGAQWDEDGEWYAMFENKPKPEVNKIFGSILKRMDEYLNNRITVDFVPDDGSDDDGLADALDTLYRADEKRSDANGAYDNAFFEGVTGGEGAWHIRTAWHNEDDDEDDRLVPIFDPIFDADATVVWDANAKLYDKSDAKKCWKLTPLTHSAFEDEWGESPATWPKEIWNKSNLDWVSNDNVYVSETYVVEKVDRVIFVYKDINGKEERYSEDDLTPEKEKELAYAGTRFDRKKIVRRNRVRKYIQSGAKILEDCGYISGSNIPIVPFYGMRFVIDGVEYCLGEVRHARDTQMLKNSGYALLELIAVHSPIEKPVFDPEEIDDYDEEWKKDLVEDKAYLRRNKLVGPDGTKIDTQIQYTRSPNIPPALAGLLQMVEVDLKDILGNQEQAEKMVSNISGKAVELIQNQISVRSFMPIDNMAKSMKRSGEIWLSIKKDICGEWEGKKHKTIDRQGKVGNITIKELSKNDNGKIIYKNDISKANHTVDVSVGPTSESRRATVVKEMRELITITKDNEDQKVLSYMILLNMEGEGLEEIRKYSRNKLIGLGVIEPTEEERQKLIEESQNTPPNPQDEFLRSEAAKNLAGVEKIKADIQETGAKIEKTRADTIKTLSEVDANERVNVVESGRLMSNQSTPMTEPSDQSA